MDKQDKPAYIGVKMILAEPMTRGAYNDYRGWKMPPAENRDDEGYLVVYPDSDGYESWSPKAVFDAAYFPLTSRGVITPEDVERFVGEGAILSSKLGAKTTVAQARCLTGFEVTEASSCVVEKNYDQNKGTEIAIGRIQSKIWAHLGFVLQWAIHGLKNG